MPSIYVACLASYNHGRLHGVSIDLDNVTDADDIRDQIAAMLRESPHPNVEVDCPDCEVIRRGYGVAEGHSFTGRDIRVPAIRCATCGGKGKVPSAEEWAIHDYDDLPSTFGEHPDLDELAAYVEAVDEHGEAFAAYWDHESRVDVADAVEGFEDAYAGEYRNTEEWAEAFLEDTGAFQGASELVCRYFDFETYARDARLGGDMYFLDNGKGGVYAFHNH